MMPASAGCEIVGSKIQPIYLETAKAASDAISDVLGSCVQLEN
jgi:hypothetical protein